MHVIHACDVGQALYLGLEWLRVAGVLEHSRNGAVLVSPQPVTTVYHTPANRVIRSGRRDANPFFHLVEALWMLAGRDDVKVPAYFAKQLASFSDDGVTLNGAYGFRWRNHFEHDQLWWIIHDLRSDPSTRRCVLGMWDPANDPRSVSSGSKDVPCNTQAFFRTRGKLLDMTVTCRSNDVVWGAYGANAVHFSMLHEYVAAMSGLQLGIYYQVSNNYHIYTDRPDVTRLYDSQGFPLEQLQATLYPCHTVPLVDRPAYFDADLLLFMGWLGRVLDDGVGAVTPLFANGFFLSVAVPMVEAYLLHKHDCTNAAIVHLTDTCEAVDWRDAGIEWLQRRVEKCNAS